MPPATSYGQDGSHHQQQHHHNHHHEHQHHGHQQHRHQQRQRPQQPQQPRQQSFVTQTLLPLLVYLSIILTFIAPANAKIPSSQVPNVGPQIYPIIPKSDRNEPAFVLGILPEYKQPGGIAMVENSLEKMAKSLKIQGYGLNPETVPITIRNQHYICILPQHRYPFLRHDRSELRDVEWWGDTYGSTNDNNNNGQAPHPNQLPYHTQHSTYIPSPLLDLTPTDALFQTKAPQTTTSQLPGRNGGTTTAATTPPRPQQSSSRPTTHSYTVPQILQPMTGNILYQSKNPIHNPIVNPTTATTPPTPRITAVSPGLNPSSNPTMTGTIQNNNISGSNNNPNNNHNSVSGTTEGPTTSSPSSSSSSSVRHPTMDRANWFLNPFHQSNFWSGSGAETKSSSHHNPRQQNGIDLDSAFTTPNLIPFPFISNLVPHSPLTTPQIVKAGAGGKNGMYFTPDYYRTAPSITTTTTSTTHNNRNDPSTGSFDNTTHVLWEDLEALCFTPNVPPYAEDYTPPRSLNQICPFRTVAWGKLDRNKVSNVQSANQQFVAGFPSTTKDPWRSPSNIRTWGKNDHILTYNLNTDMSNNNDSNKNNNNKAKSNTNENNKANTHPYHSSPVLDFLPGSHHFDKLTRLANGTYTNDKGEIVPIGEHYLNITIPVSSASFQNGNLQFTPIATNLVDLALALGQSDSGNGFKGRTGVGTGAKQPLSLQHYLEKTNSHFQFFTDQSPIAGSSNLIYPQSLGVLFHNTLNLIVGGSSFYQTTTRNNNNDNKNNRQPLESPTVPHHQYFLSRLLADLKPIPTTKESKFDPNDIPNLPTLNAITNIPTALPGLPPLTDALGRPLPLPLHPTPLQRAQHSAQKAHKKYVQSINRRNSGMMYAVLGLFTSTITTTGIKPSLQQTQHGEANPNNQFTTPLLGMNGWDGSSFTYPMSLPAISDAMKRSSGYSLDPLRDGLRSPPVGDIVPPPRLLQEVLGSYFANLDQIAHGAALQTLGAALQTLGVVNSTRSVGAVSTPSSPASPSSSSSSSSTTTTTTAGGTTTTTTLPTALDPLHSPKVPKLDPIAPSREQLTRRHVYDLLQAYTTDPFAPPTPPPTTSQYHSDPFAMPDDVKKSANAPFGSDLEDFEAILERLDAGLPLFASELNLSVWQVWENQSQFVEIVEKLWERVVKIEQEEVERRQHSGSSSFIDGIGVDKNDVVENEPDATTTTTTTTSPPSLSSSSSSSTPISFRLPQHLQLTSEQVFTAVLYRLTYLYLPPHYHMAFLKQVLGLKTVKQQREYLKYEINLCEYEQVTSWYEPNRVGGGRSKQPQSKSADAFPIVHIIPTYQYCYHPLAAYPYEKKIVGQDKNHHQDHQQQPNKHKHNNRTAIVLPASLQLMTHVPQLNVDSIIPSLRSTTPSLPDNQKYFYPPALQLSIQQQIQQQQQLQQKDESTSTSASVGTYPHSQRPLPFIPPPIAIPSPTNHLEAAYLIDSVFGNFFLTYDHLHSNPLTPTTQPPSTLPPIRGPTKVDPKTIQTEVENSLRGLTTTSRPFNLNQASMLPCLPYAKSPNDWWLYSICPTLVLQFHVEAVISGSKSHFSNYSPTQADLTAKLLHVGITETPIDPAAGLPSTPLDLDQHQFLENLIQQQLGGGGGAGAAAVPPATTSPTPAFPTPTSTTPPPLPPQNLNVAHAINPPRSEILWYDLVNFYDQNTLGMLLPSLQDMEHQFNPHFSKATQRTSADKEATKKSLLHEMQFGPGAPIPATNKQPAANTKPRPEELTSSTTTNDNDLGLLTSGLHKPLLTNLARHIEINAVSRSTKATSTLSFMNTNNDSKSSTAATTNTATATSNVGPSSTSKTSGDHTQQQLTDEQRQNQLFPTVPTNSNLSRYERRRAAMTAKKGTSSSTTSSTTSSSSSSSSATKPKVTKPRSVEPGKAPGLVDLAQNDPFFSDARATHVYGRDMGLGHDGNPIMAGSVGTMDGANGSFGYFDHNAVKYGGEGVISRENQRVYKDMAYNDYFQDMRLFGLEVGVNDEDRIEEGLLSSTPSSSTTTAPATTTTPTTTSSTTPNTTFTPTNIQIPPPNEDIEYYFSYTLDHGDLCQPTTQDEREVRGAGRENKPRSTLYRFFCDHQSYLQILSSQDRIFEHTGSDGYHNDYYYPEMVGHNLKTKQTADLMEGLVPPKPATSTTPTSATSTTTTHGIKPSLIDLAYFPSLPSILPESYTNLHDAHRHFNTQSETIPIASNEAKAGVPTIKHHARVTQVHETTPCAYTVDIVTTAVCQFSLNQPLFKPFWDASAHRIITQAEQQVSGAGAAATNTSAATTTTNPPPTATSASGTTLAPNPNHHQVNQYREEQQFSSVGSQFQPRHPTRAASPATALASTTNTATSITQNSFQAAKKTRLAQLNPELYPHIPTVPASSTTGSKSSTAVPTTEVYDPNGDWSLGGRGDLFLSSHPLDFFIQDPTRWQLHEVMCIAHPGAYAVTAAATQYQTTTGHNAPARQVPVSPLSSHVLFNESNALQLPSQNNNIIKPTDDASLMLDLILDQVTTQASLKQLITSQLFTSGATTTPGGITFPAPTPTATITPATTTATNNNHKTSYNFPILEPKQTPLATSPFEQNLFPLLSSIPMRYNTEHTEGNVSNVIDKYMSAGDIVRMIAQQQQPQ